MRAFTQHRGTVVAMDRVNVDTDQIIPKQFLKRIERSGFGQYLFFDWRFDAQGNPDPQFELNQPLVAGASILLARRNFGSGSSREHAVWALEDYGIRAVIAPSFADIFYNNCFKNGVLPITLPEPDVDSLFSAVKNCEQPFELEIDLENCTVRDSSGHTFEFEIQPQRRHCLLHGLDDIGLTLQHVDKITAFEQARGAAV